MRSISSEPTWLVSEKSGVGADRTHDTCIADETSHGDGYVWASSKAKLFILSLQSDYETLSRVHLSIKVYVVDCMKPTHRVSITLPLHSTSCRISDSVPAFPANIPMVVGQNVTLLSDQYTTSKPLHPLETSVMKEEEGLQAKNGRLAGVDSI
jgi:hypothetical protein